MVKLQCQKASFFSLNDSPKFSQLPAQYAAALYNIGRVAILLASTGKSLKFRYFGSMQNLVSNSSLKFILFRLL